MRGFMVGGSFQNIHGRVHPATDPRSQPADASGPANKMPANSPGARKRRCGTGNDLSFNLRDVSRAESYSYIRPRLDRNQEFSLDEELK